ncbi:hypothetical protein LCM02_15760 [Lutimonas saemankumensis]|uniref:hypothetical protein n=1 Tax=Lutimonas saemankumensis TaxID=483016 RepID=UPI001CD629CA|nr:hypothetical protein [Lutimonas saemankumensis]MCA0933918.1 hypothetical protein [Lutimonas saemankumensis]
MKNKFKITGLYYEVQDFKLRKYLNIRRKNSLIERPDIMVIMMNPGGSKPVDGIDNNILESEAIPDRTQDQIMKVLTACKLEYARVLNLSDIREPKSKQMLLKVLEMDKKGIAHSIFDDRRKDDFDSLFIKDVPVLFAWGVGKELKILAEKAIEAIDNDNPIGLKKEGVDWAYYHPLPQNFQKQDEWVDNIIEAYNKFAKQGAV